MGGHSGYLVTYHRIKKIFAWPGLKKSVKEWVDKCDICKKAKPERIAYPGLLQPLKVPAGAWEVISMDFVDGLPKSGGFNCIMVVVDKFSRYAHFVPLAHPYTAHSVALAFMREIHKLHSMPLEIVSDRDPIFTSKVWQELFRIAGTKLCMSTAHHPETDGQTERVNQCMEGYLRCFVHSCQTKWIQWLPLAEFWYNTSFHSSLQKSPFEVLYGHSPRFFGIEGFDSCAVPNLEEWLQERQLMTNLLKMHLERVRQRMKHQADKGMTERQFEVLGTGCISSYNHTCNLP
jgi:transposase InsO family protein